VQDEGVKANHRQDRQRNEMRRKGRVLSGGRNSGVGQRSQLILKKRKRAASSYAGEDRKSPRIGLRSRKCPRTQTGASSLLRPPRCVGEGSEGRQNMHGATPLLRGGALLEKDNILKGEGKLFPGSMRV